MVLFPPKGKLHPSAALEVPFDTGGMVEDYQALPESEDFVGDTLDGHGESENLRFQAPDNDEMFQTRSMVVETDEV